jgi:hypothetical protein
MKTHSAILACSFFILAVSTGSAVTVTVPGTADPWLAGMTNGATASGGDSAPTNSPVQVVGLPIIPGTSLVFSASGLVANNTGRTFYGPDGNFDNSLKHGAGAENGMGSCTSPLDSLVGVFLNQDMPTLTAAPSAFDFTTQSARDYTSLSPALKQVFFIGDGLTSSGMTQAIVVPPDATRLFLGTMDGSTWYNNVGSFTVTVEPLPQLSIVANDTSSLRISWPTNSTGFSLEYATNCPASEWFAVTNNPVITADQFTVTVDSLFKQQFFRLRRF